MSYCGMPRQNHNVYTRASPSYALLVLDQVLLSWLPNPRIHQVRRSGAAEPTMRIRDDRASQCDRCRACMYLPDMFVSSQGLMTVYCFVSTLLTGPGVHGLFLMTRSL